MLTCCIDICCVQVTRPHAQGVETGTLVDFGDAANSSQRLGPAAEVNGQGTVPSTDKPSDAEFDMFAQSRQSFEENLPRVKYLTVLFLVNGPFSKYIHNKICIFMNHRQKQ